MAASFRTREMVLSGMCNKNGIIPNRGSQNTQILVSEQKFQINPFKGGIH